MYGVFIDVAAITSRCLLIVSQTNSICTNIAMIERWRKNISLNFHQILSFRTSPSAKKFANSVHLGDDILPLTSDLQYKANRWIQVDATIAAPRGHRATQPHWPRRRTYSAQKQHRAAPMPNTCFHHRIIYNRIETPQPWFALICRDKTCH